MMRFSALTVGLLISASAHAQEPRALTLAETVAMAHRNAPEAVQAKGQLRTSAAGVRAAYASFLPSVSLSAGSTRQSSGSRTRIENGQVIIVPEDPWSSSIGFGASVELFDGGGRFFDLRQAQARSAAAKVNEVTQRFDVALAAKQQFFNVLAAREAQAAAAAQLEQAEQQRVVSVARARAKVATRSDSLRAEIQVRNAQLAVLDAKNDLETANAGLTRVVGSPEPVTAAAGDSLDLPGLAVDQATLRNLAVNGPAVQLAQADLEVARAGERGAWTNYLPSLSASYSRSGSGTGQNPTLNPDGFDYNGSFRFSLNFPVFDQLRREQQVTLNQVARQNAEATLRDQRLAATESIVQTHGAFESAAERVATQTATVAAAEEDLRVQQQRYAVGGSTLLDVLGSQTQLNQARRDLIRARYDQRVAKAQLESLVGREL
jgi:outer membrane protein